MLTWKLVSLLLVLRLAQPAPGISSAAPDLEAHILSYGPYEGNDLTRYFRGEAADEESEEEVLDGHEPVELASGERTGSSQSYSLLGTDSAPHPCTTNDRWRSLRGPPGDALPLTRGL
jgi:hypothetical protein